MLTILGALIVLGMLVAVHEGGHFLAARMLGITVEKFSIGFGKPIFKFTKNGVEYSLSWIPLGGYVKMKGDSLEDEDSVPGGFLSSPWWKRAIIAFAGPFTNLIFALLILMASFMFAQKVTDHYPIVGQVNSEFSTYLQQGDTIEKINGEPIRGWYDAITKLNDNKSNSITYTRDNMQATVDIPLVSLREWADFEKIRPLIEARVGEVLPKSPAYNSGLKEGDLITSVNGVVVNDWMAMNQEVGKNDENIEVVIERNGEVLIKNLSKMELPDDDRKLIGITQQFPVMYSYRLGFGEAIKTGFETTFSIVKLHYVSLYQMIKKPESFKNSIGGPVMIFSVGRDHVKQGVARALQFVGFLNIVLMVMNLLPIPVLDGGHIMFAFIEGIRGKKLEMKTQMILQQIGMFLLLSLMIYAFYSDFQGLISRYYTNS